MAYIYYPSCSIITIKKQFELYSSICFIQNDHHNIIFRIPESIIDQIAYGNQIDAILGDRKNPNNISVFLDTQQTYDLPEPDKQHAKYKAPHFLTTPFYVAMAIGKENGECDVFASAAQDKLDMYKKALSMAMLDHELPQSTNSFSKRTKI